MEEKSSDQNKLGLICPQDIKVEVSGRYMGIAVQKPDVNWKFRIRNHLVTGWS